MLFKIKVFKYTLLLKIYYSKNPLSLILRGNFSIIAMNYKLVLNTKSETSNIYYNTITFDTFKINIIDRYKGVMSRNPILCDTILKVRTLDDQLIKTREGNSRVKLKGDDLEKYKNLMDILNSYNYKNRLIKQKEADEDYVHFVIRIYIDNYQIN